jgi:hypothetical protein
MAFAKPVIVIGEAGFSLPFTPDTSEALMAAGFYGVGGDAGTELPVQLESLILDQSLRGELGRFGRQLAAERFDVGVVSEHLVGLYDEVVRRGVRHSAGMWALAAGQTMAKVLLQTKHAAGRAARARREPASSSQAVGTRA